MADKALDMEVLAGIFFTIDRWKLTGRELSYCCTNLEKKSISSECRPLLNLASPSPHEKCRRQQKTCLIMAYNNKKNIYPLSRRKTFSTHISVLD